MTNQIVLACKDHIKEATVSAIDDKDRLWQKISEEVSEKDTVTTCDSQQKLSRGQVDSKVKVSMIITSPFSSLINGCFVHNSVG